MRTTYNLTKNRMNKFKKDVIICLSSGIEFAMTYNSIFPFEIRFGQLLTYIAIGLMEAIRCIPNSCR